MGFKLKAYAILVLVCLTSMIIGPYEDAWRPFVLLAFVSLTLLLIEIKKK